RGDFYVSVEGSDASAGSESAPWRHIQFAVEHTPSSAVIHIGPGRYVERLVMSSPKTLVGAGRGETVIATSGDGSVITAAADLALRDLTLTGFEDWTGGYGAHSVRRLIEVRGAVLVAHRIGAYNFRNYGIIVEDGSFDIREVLTGIDPDLPSPPDSYDLAADISIHVIRSSGVIEGVVSGLEPGKPKGHRVDHQIRLEPGPGDNIVVRSSTLYGYGREMGEGYADGIQIYAPQAGDPPSILIESNLIQGPLPGLEASSGVEMMGGGVHVVLRDNIIERFARGFSATGRGTALVEGNTFGDNTVDGVRIDAELEVDLGGGALGSTGGNLFRGNAGYAVSARDTSGQALSRTFHAVGNDWGVCFPAAIRARTFGRVRVERPLGCGS
ncbi:MAG: DUF1565 domain-containing protein, partial [Gemmatimonadetes bacterium]|nr:DUF1565 domain-containing protein [Gemmatimonadota bacterium]